jgi:hypothetical protein
MVHLKFIIWVGKIKHKPIACVLYCAIFKFQKFKNNANEPAARMSLRNSRERLDEELKEVVRGAPMDETAPAQ